MKKTLFWVLAAIITLASAYYQRKTGPTYPKNIKAKLENEIIEFKLPRSGDSNKDQEIKVPFQNESFKVILNYRRYPVNESFLKTDFMALEENFVAFLPKQPPAGKLEYYLVFKDLSNNTIFETEHAIIRFKGSVPAWALIPHVIFMFVAMLLSNVAGLFAIGKIRKHVLYGKITLILLLIGGLVFGPIIQYYAFGQAWTGVPLGWDLTDNKTLVGVLFWLVAVLSNRKNPKYRYTIIASIILLIVYIIPHSLFGSELDYESGKVVTGFIKLFF